MDIFFSKSNPLNAILRDDDKRSLCRVNRPFALSNKVTTVTRSGGRGRVGEYQVMARIEWHRFSKTRYEFDGHPMVAKVFLKRRKSGRQAAFFGLLHVVLLMIESRNAENIFFKAPTGVHTSGSRDPMHRHYVMSLNILSIWMSQRNATDDL